MWRYIVPDVRQLPPDQAEKKLTDKGYQVKTIEVPAENYSQVGKVMKQDPAPGEYILVWNDWIGPITLYIAKKGSFVPDILLKTEAEAINTIKNAGYVPKVEYNVNENQGIAGKVWTTDPLPYRNHPQGGTVVLRVAKPGQAMENFIGKHAAGVPQWTAEINRIKSLGLKATVFQDKTTTVPQEDQQVYAQTPAPGTVLVAGSEIKVSAYKYVPPPPVAPPKPTPMTIMPGLVGQTEQDAKAFLTKAGLQVSVKYVSAPKEKQGRVTGQSVPANTRTAGPVVLTVGSK